MKAKPRSDAKGMLSLPGIGKKKSKNEKQIGRKESAVEAVHKIEAASAFPMNDAPLSSSKKNKNNSRGNGSSEATVSIGPSAVGEIIDSLSTSQRPAASKRKSKNKFKPLNSDCQPTNTSGIKSAVSSKKSSTAVKMEIMEHSPASGTGSRAEKRRLRSAIRKQARKAALKNAKENLKKGAELTPDMQALIERSKKKNKRNPKRKTMSKASEEAGNQLNTDNADESSSADELDRNNPIRLAEKKLKAGRFRFLNEKLYTMTGSDAWEFFQKDPEAFDCYHNGFAEQTKKWPNHPLNVIIKWLKGMKDHKVVYDLGCGEAKIAQALGDNHEVKSFDLVAVNDKVTACDMADLPVEERSADIVIYCLSLMGTNLRDFIKEARRVLKLGGIMKIAEVTSRFINLNKFCDAICKMGFEQKEKRAVTDYFTMLEFVKIQKAENKRPMGLQLKACLYKKR